MKKFNIILVLIAIVCVISCGHNANYKSSAEKNDNTKSSVPEVYCDELDRLAENGNAEAQYKMGIFLSTGKDIEKDAEEGFKWFLKAAEQGHPGAQYAVALSYHLGVVNTNYDTVVHKNETEVFKWLTKAANQGEQDAMIDLANCYREGVGTAVDYKKAAKLVRKSAESGYSRGQYAMGVYYVDGIGVQKNSNEAFKWFAKAAEQGNKDVAFNMEMKQYEY